MNVGFQAVLLAGGRGTRMATVFPGLPKALVPIGGTPLLALQLSRLRLNGCTHAVVVGGHGILDVRRALRAFPPISGVIIVEETSGTLPAALAGLGALVPPLGTVVVLNADTIVDVDIAWCVAAAPSWAAVTALLTELPTGQNERSVVLAPSGHVLAFEETDCPDINRDSASFGPSELRSSEENCVSLSNCGLYVVDGERLLLDAPKLERLGSSWERHALVHYRRQGLLGGVAPSVQYVLDVGTPPRYRQACADASFIHKISGYRQDAFESHSRLA